MLGSIEFDKEVDVGCWRLLTTGCRTEDSNTSDSAFAGRASDLGGMFTKVREKFTAGGGRSAQLDVQ